MESTFISAPQLLFVCGSDRQTHEMHQIARELSDCRVWFTPYYGGTLLTMLRELGMLERTIAGNRLGEECLGYLRNHHLPIDPDGRRARYDLVVTCSDLVLARNTRGRRLVVVHNGRLGVSHLLGSRIAHRLSRWLGQSPSRWCVTSEADRESLRRLGFPGERITVIGSAGHDGRSGGGQIRPTRIATICRDLLGAPGESREAGRAAARRLSSAAYRGYDHVVSQPDALGRSGPKRGDDRRGLASPDTRLTFSSHESHGSTQAARFARQYAGLSRAGQKTEVDSDAGQPHRSRIRKRALTVA